MSEYLKGKWEINLFESRELPFVVIVEQWEVWYLIFADQVPFAVICQIFLS